MLSKYKDKATPYAKMFAKPFNFIHPNLLTLFGFMATIVFFVLMMLNRFLPAILVFPLTLFDFIDGQVARDTGKVSNFGGVLDSTLDRLSDGLIITSFGFSSLVSWECVIFLLLSSYLVSYIRSRAELAGKGKFKLNVGLIERGERFIAIYIGLIIYFLKPSFHKYNYNLLEIVFMVLGILSFVTVIQRLKKSKLLLQN